MRPTLTLYCKQCQVWRRLPFEPRFTGSELKHQSMCPKCQAALSGKRGGFDAEGRQIGCGWCESKDLYRRKAFPKGQGIGIVVVAAAATLVLAWQEIQPPWLVYVPLVGAALADAVLYFVTPDAICCYRCPCVHQGYPLGREFAPYDHAKADQIRLEKGAQKASA